MTRIRRCAGLVAAGLLLASGLAGCSIAGTPTPTPTPATAAAQDLVKYPDSWVGALAMGDDATFFVPFVYSPNEGKVAFGGNIPANSIAPLQLSPDQQWLGVSQDETQVVLGALPKMTTTKVISLADVPLKSPDWHVVGATFGSDRGADLWVVTSDGPRRTGEYDPFATSKPVNVQVWSIDVGVAAAKPKLLTEYVQDPNSDQRFDTVKGRLVNKTELNEFRLTGAADDGTVALPGGAQIRLDTTSGTNSTTFRTWYRASASGQWEQIGKPGSMALSGKPVILAYPSALVGGH